MRFFAPRPVRCCHGRPHLHCCQGHLDGRSRLQKKGLEAQGYQIKTFKVSKGQCYEIYGFDKAGKKVEIYFDPVTAAVLETK